MVMPSLKEIFLMLLGGLMRNCPDCRKGKIVCLIACNDVSKRLDELDAGHGNQPVKRDYNAHPCLGCGLYAEGCSEWCRLIEKWELQRGPA